MIPHELPRLGVFCGLLDKVWHMKEHKLDSDGYLSFPTKSKNYQGSKKCFEFKDVVDLNNFWHKVYMTFSKNQVHV